MKHLLFLLFTFLGITVFGQSSKFQFGFQLQAGISDLNFQNKSNEAFEAAVQDGAAPRFSPGAQLFGRYQIAPRFSIQAGLGYSLSGYRVKPFELVITTPDSPEGQAVGNASGILHYHDATFSMQGKLKLIKGLYLAGGATGLFKLARKQTVKIDYYQGETTRVTEKMPSQYRDIRQANLRGDVGFGYECKGFGNTRIYIEPTFGYTFFPVFEEGTSKYGQYATGLNLGCVF